MITIDREVKISGRDRKVEFDLNDLPDGEYKMRLVIDTTNKISSKIDFSAWASDIHIPAELMFSREEIYGDDGR